ncbi:MAG: hypothetical protein ACLFV2_03480 [Desulfurivibrionaceae bacterium]
MRCPKCGYISFDQQKTCANCSRDLQEFMREFNGTGMKAEKTSFLDSLIADSGEQSVPGRNSEEGGEKEDPSQEEFYFDEVPAAGEEGTGIEFSLDEEEEEVEEKSTEDSAPGDQKTAGEDLDFGEVGSLEIGSEEAPAGDEDVPEEEEPLPPEEPDFKLQLESDIMEEEPDEEGLEYDLEDIDMSDLVIEGEEEEGAADQEKKKNESPLEDLSDIEL